jgi:ADP-heptose:LPS heptosyltransferase
MPEDTENGLRQQYGPCLGMSSPFDTVYRPIPPGTDLTGKRIMVFRFGGIGDMLFLEPVLRWLKVKFPGLFIRFATANRDPLIYNDAIDELHLMPFDKSLLDDVDYHAYFQGIIESNPDAAKVVPAVDLFFRAFNYDPQWIGNKEKRPMVKLSQDEKEWGKKEAEKRGLNTMFTIGIQIDTSSVLRNFPKLVMKQVIDVLSLEHDVRIMLIGTKEQEVIAHFYKEGRESIRLATEYTVRQQIILAHHYQLIIAPDSFMVQVAGAIGIPVVGLYGPFASRTRMGYFEKAIGIDVDCKCAPCAKHTGIEPCVKGFPSPCFGPINADTVLLACNYLRKKCYGDDFRYCSKGGEK